MSSGVFILGDVPWAFCMLLVMVWWLSSVFEGPTVALPGCRLWILGDFLPALLSSDLLCLVLFWISSNVTTVRLVLISNLSSAYPRRHRGLALQVTSTVLWFSEATNGNVVSPIMDGYFGVSFGYIHIPVPSEISRSQLVVCLLCLCRL